MGLSYPFEKYSQGGKSCLTCSYKVHEVMNARRDGCECASGYGRNGAGVCTAGVSEAVVLNASTPANSGRT